METIKVKQAVIHYKPAYHQVYDQNIKHFTDDYKTIHNTAPKFLIQTYGCQMNEHDSEKMSAMLINLGFEEGQTLEESALILYNTCSIRENAEHKVYGHLGSLKSLKRRNPDLIIGVCGCMMQQAHIVETIKTKYKHVDLIFGTHNLHTLPELLNKTVAGDAMIVEVWDNADSVVEGVPIKRKKDSKAFVNIIYGCDNYCTYCVVPYTRGKIRSRRAEDIVEESRQLIEQGVKELTFLGQNVNSYGLDLEKPVTFAQLLTMINQIEGKFRIRFMTPHPKDLSDELIAAIANLDKVCEYVHLPVQAGSDSVLKAMNRRYTVANYLEKVHKLKAAVPNVTLSTDIIIGFPGETEEDVDSLIEVIKEVEYDSAFTFIYSKRGGTPAAKFKNQIPEPLKHKRFERMLNVLNDIIKEKNQALVGKEFEVLIEGNARHTDYMIGRTRQNHSVNVLGSDLEIGQFVDVKITKAGGFSIYAERIK